MFGQLFGKNEKSPEQPQEPVARALPPEPTPPAVSQPSAGSEPEAKVVPLQREVPWCTIFLVAAACTCHTIVLLGNHKMADSLENIGTSTSGWSGIGLDLSEALHSELDHTMVNLTNGLTKCISLTLKAQELIDSAVAIAGSSVETVKESDTVKAIGTLQEQINTSQRTGIPDKNAPILDGIKIVTNKTANGSVWDGIKAVTNKAASTAVQGMADAATQQVIDSLNELMDSLKPALLQVGDFITKFGPKIQTVIEGFSITLDRVQKLFDQVMAQLSTESNAESEEELEYNTFTLYDVSGDGYVDAADLEMVAKLYGITALKGSKPSELIEKYDQDGDGNLRADEYHLFVQDPSLPNVMSTVLRTYSKRLSEISGNVAAAKQRDEVSSAVVDYMTLVCAKNLTKVAWVSQRLSNGSLPLEFTADVMVQFALKSQDPDTLTTVDTGGLVIGKMMDMNKSRTVHAYDLLSNSTYWISEGFDPADQTFTLDKISKWMQSSGSLIQLNTEMAKKSMKAAMKARRRQKDAVYDQLFESTIAQNLQINLLGDVPAPTDTAATMIAQGVPAKPETLEFAQYLSWNASATAKRFQKLCFDYSSESSNAVDSFATQITSMVSKIKGFIEMLMKYASPAGFQMLEDQVNDFIANAKTDLKGQLMKEMGSFAAKAVPVSTGQYHDYIKFKHGIQPVGVLLEHTLGREKVLEIGSQLSDLLGKQVHSLTIRELEVDLTRKMKEEMTWAMSKASSHVNSVLGKSPTDASSFMQAEVLLDKAEAHDEQSNETSADSGVWAEMYNVIGTLATILPQATSTLKFARKEVSMLSSNLDSIFSVFQDKGPPIFIKVSGLWMLTWSCYFFFICPITLLLLVYAFWAGGYMGGPGTPVAEEVQDPDPPTTFCGRLMGCCASCCSCCGRTCHNVHDYALFFWACLIIMEVVCLIIFAVSILLCILAGVKVFLANGCSQIYVLGDPTICGQTMSNLRQFLDTFLGGIATVDLPDVCTNEKLLTCNMISKEMKLSGIMTTIFSFLAALISTQFLIESAMLHSRAVKRREYAKRL